MKFLIYLILILFLLAVAFTIGTNNNQIVDFDYLIDQGQFRLSNLLGILLSVGFLLGWLLTGIFYIKVRLKLNTAQRKLRKLEKSYEQEVAINRKNELMTNDPMNSSENN